MPKRESTRISSDTQTAEQVENLPLLQFFPILRDLLESGWIQFLNVMNSIFVTNKKIIHNIIYTYFILFHNNILPRS